MHLLAERFIFWGDDWGFLEVSQHLFDGINVAPLFANFVVLTSKVYVQLSTFGRSLFVNRFQQFLYISIAKVLTSVFHYCSQQWQPFQRPVEARDGPEEAVEGEGSHLDGHSSGGSHYCSPAWIPQGCRVQDEGNVSFCFFWTTKNVYTVLCKRWASRCCNLTNLNEGTIGEVVGSNVRCRNKKKKVPWFHFDFLFPSC